MMKIAKIIFKKVENSIKFIQNLIKSVWWFFSKKFQENFDNSFFVKFQEEMNYIHYYIRYQIH